MKWLLKSFTAFRGFSAEELDKRQNRPVKEHSYL
jgi:hypothetical protein